MNTIDLELDRLATPVVRVIDRLFAPDPRFAWLSPELAAQIRQWREEDRAAGIIWNDEIHRDGVGANNAPPLNR